MKTLTKTIEVTDGFEVEAYASGFEIGSGLYTGTTFEATFNAGYMQDFTLPVNKEFIEELRKRNIGPNTPKIKMEIKFID